MKRVIALTAASILGWSVSPDWVHGEPSPSLRETGQTQGRQTPPLLLDSAIQRVLETSVPRVVRVCFGEEDVITGTMISEDGLVLTCAHLPVPVGGLVQVGFSNGRRIPAKVLSKLPEEGQSNLGRDLALLQLSEPGVWPAAAVATAAPSEPDEPVLALGFPDTLLYGADRAADPLYIRLGHPIRSPYQPLPGQLITSIEGTGGDSGGPLFDLSGRLVGVVHGGDASGAHLNYTRIEVLRQHWERLAPGRPPPAIPTIEPVVVVPSPAPPRQIRDAAVEIHSKARWIGLGCVVGDGLILTKASELGPNLTVVLAGDYVGIAEVAASDPGRDLALLRLPHAPELTREVEPIRWKPTEDVKAGQSLTLATPGFLTPPVGVACFTPRPVPRIEGCIPCQVEQTDGGVRVVKVLDELRAFRLRQPTFPLRSGDIVTEIEGNPVTDLAAYGKLVYDVDRIGVHPNVAGEPIRISYRRGESTLQGSIVLEFSRTPSGQLVRPVSHRYSSFPSAIATNLSVRPEHCGGPIVDANGRVIGLLIARAPFIESLVLPAGEVAESLEGMMRAPVSAK